MLSLNVISGKANCKSNKLNKDDIAVMQMTRHDVAEISKKRESVSRALFEQQREVADRVCTGCPHMLECRTIGYLYREEGVWGGMTYLDRKLWYKNLMNPATPEDDKPLVEKMMSHSQLVAWRTGRKLKHPDVDYYLDLNKQNA